MAGDKDLFLVQVFWKGQSLRFNFETQESALAAYMALLTRGKNAIQAHGLPPEDAEDAPIEVIDDVGNRGNFPPCILAEAAILMTDFDGDLEAVMDTRLKTAVMNGKLRTRIANDPFARTALPPQIQQLLIGGG